MATRTNHTADQVNEQSHAVKVLSGNVPAPGSGSAPATLPETGQQWPLPLK